MANQQHVDMLLHDGVEAWNQWRKENPDVRPDLSGADLSEANLNGADLTSANLTSVNLIGANLIGAYLSFAHLTRANLSGADLMGAGLVLADLSGAYLNRASLNKADLRRANLSGAGLVSADLSETHCVETNFSDATLTGCNVYGISAWDINLEGAVQADLHIIPGHGWDGSISWLAKPILTVDNLKVAQFLYLLLHDEEIRTVLDVISSKVVLILGHFSEGRKPILDALRKALRNHSNGYIPVLFDFTPQADKPVLETVKTLGNLARFVVADLTDPHMVRAELTAIIPNVPTLPVQPIIEGNADLPTEYESWALYRSVLPIYRYTDLSHLLANLDESVITPVEAHVQARRL